MWFWQQESWIIPKSYQLMLKLQCIGFLHIRDKWSKFKSFIYQGKWHWTKWDKLNICKSPWNLYIHLVTYKGVVLQQRLRKGKLIWRDWTTEEQGPWYDSFCTSVCKTNVHILLNAQSTYNDFDGDRDVMKEKYWYWQIYMIYKVLDILLALKIRSFILGEMPFVSFRLSLFQL